MSEDEKAKNLLEKLKKDYSLGSIALAIASESFPEELLKTITPHDFCSTLYELPEEECAAFLGKVASFQKNFQFWHDCRNEAVNHGYNRIRDDCSLQMAEFAQDFKKLSSAYSNNPSREIKGAIIKKMREFVKEHPDKV